MFRGEIRCLYDFFPAFLATEDVESVKRHPLEHTLLLVMVFMCIEIGNLQGHRGARRIQATPATECDGGDKIQYSAERLNGYEAKLVAVSEIASAIHDAESVLWAQRAHRRRSICYFVSFV